MPGIPSKIRKPSTSLLLLTKYDRNGASSRYRSFQFVPVLEKAGFDVTIKPLFDKRYLKQLYQHGAASPWYVIRRYLRRLMVLGSAIRYDLVFLEKELLPYTPAWPEWLLKQLGVRYVADYDDALFHQYDQHSSRLIRWLLRRKIASVMRYAEAVTCGNTYLAGYAEHAPVKHIEIVPTVVDLSRYPVEAVSPAESDKQLVIGWIGSPTTTRYLEAIAPALARVCKQYDARVELVGAGPVELPGVPFSNTPWVENTEVEHLKSMDIGVMPVPDESWERGKCGLKIIQYMAAGLPVVASPVGVNSRIVEAGSDGFLAQTHDDWVETLDRLLSNEALRSTMGAAGRRKVEKGFALAEWGPRLVAILHAALSERHNA